MMLDRIRFIALIATALQVAACGGAGSTSSPSAPSQNQPPQISLPDSVSVLAGRELSVRPNAYDPDGQRLTFTIANAPSWLSISSSTGELSGTPTEADVGTYERIRIAASDGNSESYTQISITVTVAADGRATVSWQAPSERTDGTPLTDLAGFRVYYGESAADLRYVIQVSDPGARSWVVTDLTVGTWYFAATAYDASGAESSRSNVASKTIA